MTNAIAALPLLPQLALSHRPSARSNNIKNKNKKKQNNNRR
jgi:hypothetical protein